MPCGSDIKVGSVDYNSQDSVTKQEVHKKKVCFVYEYDVGITHFVDLFVCHEVVYFRRAIANPTDKSSNKLPLSVGRGEGGPTKKIMPPGKTKDVLRLFCSFSKYLQSRRFCAQKRTKNIVFFAFFDLFCCFCRISSKSNREQK